MKTLTKNYNLQCTFCQRELDDDGFILNCGNGHPPALLRTEYFTPLDYRQKKQDLFQFADWMPVCRKLKGSYPPITYKSREFASYLGLENLYITFNGYWPEKGAYMTTGTFKECEAYSVCARLPENFNDILVIASAGNTARAFAKVCSENGIKLLLVVPDYLKKMLWFEKEISRHVNLLAIGGNGDYFDAQRVAGAIAAQEGFIPEGGSFNVARRDGMGTVLLSAVKHTRVIPDFYFQAVGSGAGAIASWETNLRLLASNKFGNKKMRLMVSQNAPFAPIVDSWNRGSRELITTGEAHSKNQIAKIKAAVLGNRNPTYGVSGGLFDALSDTQGTATAITNQEADKAAKIFLQEGIDISPAASIAAASLIKCCKKGLLNPSSVVLLNITGGGIQRFKSENKICYLEPALTLNKEGSISGSLINSIRKLFI